MMVYSCVCVRVTVSGLVPDATTGCSRLARLAAFTEGVWILSALNLLMEAAMPCIRIHKGV